MRSVPVLLVWLYSACAWSTPQVLDELSYEGDVRAILEFPLTEYFEHQQSYPSVFSSEGIQMSANWRGHRATWEIRNGMLLLTAVLKLYGDPENSTAWEWKDITQAVFPDQKLPILASWYTGVMRMPEGKQIECFPFAYGNVHEKEVRLRIRKGLLVGSEIRRNDEEPAERCSERERAL